MRCGMRVRSLIHNTKKDRTMHQIRLTHNRAGYWVAKVTQGYYEQAQCWQRRKKDAERLLVESLRATDERWPSDERFGAYEVVGW